jgi:hypothetical protein
MRTKSRFIIVAIIILCHSFSEAQQNARTLALHKRALKEAKCVFEGTVIKQQHFRGCQGWAKLCTVFQITKIFKGSPEIKLGTIKVISDDRITDGGAPIDKKGTYIIVGAIGCGQQYLDTVIADNSMTLSEDGIILINTSINSKDKQVPQATARWLGSGRLDGGAFYNPIDSLYSFLKENGLTVQEEATTNQK